jgi:hypothetical protein
MAIVIALIKPSHSTGGPVPRLIIIGKNHPRAAPIHSAFNWGWYGHRGNKLSRCQSGRWNSENRVSFSNRRRLRAGADDNEFLGRINVVEVLRVIRSRNVFVFRIFYVNLMILEGVIPMWRSSILFMNV